MVGSGDGACLPTELGVTCIECSELSLRGYGGLLVDAETLESSNELTVSAGSATVVQSTWSWTSCCLSACSVLCSWILGKRMQPGPAAFVILPSKADTIAVVFIT